MWRPSGVIWSQINIQCLFKLLCFLNNFQDLQGKEPNSWEENLNTVRTNIFENLSYFENKKNISVNILTTRNLTRIRQLGLMKIIQWGAKKKDSAMRTRFSSEFQLFSINHIKGKFFFETSRERNNMVSFSHKATRWMEPKFSTRVSTKEKFFKISKQL